MLTDGRIWQRPITEKNRIRVIIPFEHEGCDGWAIVDSRYINAVVSVNACLKDKIVTRETGEFRFPPGSARSMVYGAFLKRGEGEYNFCSKDTSEIRLLLGRIRKTLEMRLVHMRFAFLR